MNNAIQWVDSWTLGGKLSILLFFVFAGGIIFSAMKLVKYSEVIMGKTKFGGAFVGGVLIATVTSAPELITEIAQGLNGTPGTGLADDVGANAFSAAAMAVAMFVLISSPFVFKLDKFTKWNLVGNAVLGAILAVFIFVGKDLHIGVAGKFVIGIIPILMLLSYITFLFLQWKFSKTVEEVDQVKIKKISVKKAVWMFLASSLALITFAVLINMAVSSFQDGFSIPSESAGGIFLSMTTSMPEIVAFLLLLKSKQAIAAMATLLGSQVFNMGITVFGDMAFHQAAMFDAGSNILVPATAANPVPTMTVAKTVHANWSLAAIFPIEMVFISIYAFFGKKWKNPILKYTFPTLAALTYIVGWILILTIQHH